MSRAMASVFRSAEKEWSAMGLWKRWWTSGGAMVNVGAIGGALYYRDRMVFAGVVVVSGGSWEVYLRKSRWC